MTITRTVVIERVEARPALTKTQLHVVELLEGGMTYEQAAVAMGVKLGTIRFHVRLAAMRIPGDLHATAKLIAWYRGAPLYVLERANSTHSRVLRASVAEMHATKR